MSEGDMKLRSKMRKIAAKYYFVTIFVFINICFTSPLFALAINSTAPGFTLSTLDGKRIALSDYQGKMVILKLGTTWCPGCRDQNKELQKLDGFLKEAGVPLIEVFLDDPADAIKAYQREYPMMSPVVTLLGDERLLRDYAVYAIPRLILLSAEQKVMSDSTGMTAAQIKARILQK